MFIPLLGAALYCFVVYSRSDMFKTGEEQAHDASARPEQHDSKGKGRLLSTEMAPKTGTFERNQARSSVGSEPS
jgi:hypothetical protein